MIGTSVRRREDPRLLTGRGRFVDDIRLAGVLHAAFLRSSYPHARLAQVDASAARAVDGVHAVFTGRDVESIGPLRGHLWTRVPDSITAWLHPVLRPDAQYLLPAERVRYAGEPLALVIARDRYTAEDALETIVVQYEALPAVTDVEAALAPGSPRLTPEWGDNISLHLAGTVGDPEGAFSAPAHRASFRGRVARQTGVPMETRGVAAMLDPRSGELTVWSNTQIPHVLREGIAEMLGLPEHRVRVIVADTGGGFGIKGIIYPEDILIPFAALQLGVPVKWTEDRLEHLTGSMHSRDQLHEIELAANDAGVLLGVRDRFLVDVGAFNPLRLTSGANTIAHLVGTYRVPNVAIEGSVVVTNKTVAAPYRGAGRPEAVWAMERGMDRLARQMGLDPIELRLRNTITADEMPWDTGMLYRDGQPLVYDSGDYLASLKRALDLVGYGGFRERQRLERERGRHLGLGVAAYVEGTGIGPFEGASVRVDSSGKVIVHTGACSQGQGHETVFAQIAADALGVRFEDVTVIGGDTSGVSYGWGTIASRSTVVAGNAITQAAEIVRDKVTRVAADLLETSPSDVVVEASLAYVAGAPRRSVSLREIAEACAPPRALPAGREPGLEAQAYFSPPTVTYSNGVHAAIVEVDLETGQVEIQHYVVVHDSGRLVNPALADGQIRGGVAQGIGGALLEEICYGENGELLTGSFMDYLVPTSRDVPHIVLEHLESPSPRNPLGVKGLGEGGAIPPPATIANAIEDALQPFGVVIDQAPITPNRLRELLRASGH